MAEQHGGYRRPSNPAAVSGPGSLSRRTDGGVSDSQSAQMLPDAKYGEQANFQDIQSGADLAGAPAQRPARPVIPMGADTQRPSEPVTAGSPVGEGIGPTAAGIDTRTIDQQDAAALKESLPMLEYIANRPESSPSMRIFVRRIKGNL